jgi:hypothetical protein
MAFWAWLLQNWEILNADLLECAIARIKAEKFAAFILRFAINLTACQQTLQRSWAVEYLHELLTFPNPEEQRESSR